MGVGVQYNALLWGFGEKYPKISNEKVSARVAPGRIDAATWGSGAMQSKQRMKARPKIDGGQDDGRGKGKSEKSDNCVGISRKVTGDKRIRKHGTN